MSSEIITPFRTDYLKGNIYDKELILGIIDDINFKVNMINSGEDPQDFLGPFEDEDALVAAWSDATNRAMSSKKESKDSIKSWMKRLSRD